MSMSGKTESGLPQYKDKDRVFIRSDMNTAIRRIEEAIGGASSVSSVNGKIGAVVLKAEDIEDNDENTIEEDLQYLEENKVNKEDVVDDLTTYNADKVLSAKQGMILDNKKPTSLENTIGTRSYKVEKILVVSQMPETAEDNTLYLKLETLGRNESKIRKERKEIEKKLKRR